MPPRLDVDWSTGVPGWTLGGRHLRLNEILTLVQTDDERRALIEEHRGACVALALSLAKLFDELREVEEETS